MSNFFPSTDDEPSPAGRYFKPKLNGLYTLRILSPFLAFDLAWKDKKPVRREPGYEWQDADYDAQGQFGPQPPKRCWACACWVYNFKPEGSVLAQHIAAVQVWEIPQASIRASLKNLGQDADWADPTTYDIKLTRTGTGKEIEYTITTSLPKPLPDSAIQEWDVLNAFDGFDLSRLLTGGDPFKKG